MEVALCCGVKVLPPPLHHALWDMMFLSGTQRLSVGCNLVAFELRHLVAFVGLARGWLAPGWL